MENNTIKKLYVKWKIYKTKKDYVIENIKWYENILDVWFWWQWIAYNDKNWIHNILKSKNKFVFWIDINTEAERILKNKNINFEIKNAENFNYNKKYNLIFWGDIIEHLSNPWLFLESCKKALKKIEKS